MDDAIAVLLYANRLAHRLRVQGSIDHEAPGYLLAVHDLRSLFEAILEQGDLANPRAEPNGRRGAQHAQRLQPRLG